ncbi:M1 family metallopeptidase [Piscicoccus intestinalis]|uniref:M1 family metallopeptidase n=1 Tax=Piscicoccus intestinalis TaxID=746033 RepID=UPI000AC2A07A|nr:M1 family metallopeptidase [Piscicoccus intestinalis]
MPKRPTRSHAPDDTDTDVPAAPGAPAASGDRARRDLGPLGGNETYVPGHGDRRYAVHSYDLDLTVKLAGNHVRGRAELVITPTASPDEPTGDLDRFRLDLHGLKVDGVTVDGKPAKHTRRGDHVHVSPKQPVPAGGHARVVVRYSGNPSQVRGIDGLAGWEELDDGVIVASQPHGAPSWFPCNDRPDDKAAYRIAVSTDSGYRVVANGTLVETVRRSSRATWVYEQPEPMATYLATVQIGRYEQFDLEHTDGPGGAVPITVHHPASLLRQVRSGPMARHRDMMAAFADAFGPYPFARYDVVVTPDVLEIPLEAQTMSIFGRTFVRAGWEQERLVAHELAHQWFGNAVTLGAWRDIWLHEGFACWSEWLWSERSGGHTAAELARDHHRRLAREPQDLYLVDPTPELMFDDRVYKRGGVLVQALREYVGDGAFFEFLRGWCARHRFGTVSTEGFVAQAAAELGLAPDWFDPWLQHRALPAWGD